MTIQDLINQLKQYNPNDEIDQIKYISKDKINNIIPKDEAHIIIKEKIGKNTSNILKMLKYNFNIH